MEAAMNELGPDARSILHAGRAGDEPSPEDRTRVRRALQRTLAAGGALAATSAASGAAKGAAGVSATVATSAIGVAGKVIAVIALVGTVSAAIALRPTSKAAPSSPSKATPSALAIAASPPLPTSAGEEPSSAVEKARIDEARAALPPAQAKVAASGAPTAEGLRSAAAAALPTEDPLSAETRRLREAHGALQGGDPERALSLLDEQSAAYAQGELREERAAARVLALCNLGRIDEAKAAADRFLRDNPRSPLSDRIRKGCPDPAAPVGAGRR
jgi:hypothetical protein